MGGEPTGFDDPDCLGYIEEIEARVRKLEAAARAVVAFDWSDNDDDAVAAIDDLRTLVEKGKTDE